MSYIPCGPSCPGLGCAWCGRRVEAAPLPATWNWTWTGQTRPAWPSLSDDDIERVAKRLAELLKEQK